jgi:hypothetical protein
MDDGFNLALVLNMLLQVIMVIGPVLGYIDQYLTMRKARSSQGFSAAICGVLLVCKHASPLRVIDV